MFESEIELQQIFFNQLENKKSTNTNILQEFNARFGNVDIVEVDFDCFENTLDNTQTELLSVYSNALVVGYLHKNSYRTFKYLLNKTGYTEDYLNSIILSLEKANIIFESGNRKYTICPNFQFPNLKFSSYELKLKDWKKAILQATRNTSFSYKSFVVMPNKEAIKLKENYSNIFSLYNIGLIGVTNSTHYKYISPKVQNHKYSVSPIFISSMAKCIYKKEIQAT